MSKDLLAEPSVRLFKADTSTLRPSRIPRQSALQSSVCGAHLLAHDLADNLLDVVVAEVQHDSGKPAGRKRAGEVVPDRSPILADLPF